MLGSWSRELSGSLSLGISRSFERVRLMSPAILSRLQEAMPPNWDDVVGSARGWPTCISRRIRRDARDCAACQLRGEHLGGLVAVPVQ